MLQLKPRSRRVLSIHFLLRVNPDFSLLSNLGDRLATLFPEFVELYGMSYLFNSFVTYEGNVVGEKCGKFESVQLLV